MSKEKGEKVFAIEIHQCRSKVSKRDEDLGQTHFVTTICSRNYHHPDLW